MSDPVLNKVSPLIQRQITRLETSNDFSDTAVHDLRVLTKRLRAALRLYRQVVPKSELRKVDHLVRQTAQAFSASRDSHVQLKTLKRLVKQYPYLTSAAEPVQAILLENHREVEKPDRRAAADALEEALALWQSHLAQKESDFIASGLKHAYQKAAQLGGQALADTRDEPFHQWRKWCKYWLYQQELMVKTRSSSQQIYRECLTDLGSDLGKFHDYCVLERCLQSDCEPWPDPEQMQPIIQRIAAVKRSYKRAFAADFLPLFGLDYSQVMPAESQQY